jgi:hypothetical protein
MLSGTACHGSWLCAPAVGKLAGNDVYELVLNENLSPNNFHVGRRPGIGASAFRWAVQNGISVESNVFMHLCFSREAVNILPNYLVFNISVPRLFQYETIM